MKNDTSDTKGIVGATTWAHLGLDFDVIDKSSMIVTNMTVSKDALHINVNDGTIKEASSLDLYSVSSELKKAYKKSMEKLLM